MDDLRELLMAAREDAPPPRLSVDDITAAGRQLVRRRRRVTMLSSVAGGVVAVVAGAAAALMLIAPSGIGPALDPVGSPVVSPGVATPGPVQVRDLTPAGSFEINYSGYTAGNYVVSDPELATADYLQSSVTLRDDVVTPAPSVSARPRILEAPREGRLVVYRAGAFNPAEFTRGERVAVAGKTGWVRFAGPSAMPSASADMPGAEKYTYPAVVPALAWQYAPDGWAAIYWGTWTNTPARDELVSIAANLTPAAAHPFPVGFRLKGTPPGYHLVEVGVRQRVGGDPSVLSYVRLSLKDAVSPLDGPTDFDELPTLTLTVGDVGEADVAELKAGCGNNTVSCVMPLSDRLYARAENIGPKLPSGGELALLLKALVVERSRNATDWPAATDVFPS